ncbi:MAG: carbohydrate ABC transporter permease [Actinomycetes bacterium]
MSVATHTATIVPRQPPAQVRRRRMLYAVGNHSMAIALSLMFLIPLFVVVVTAFMSRQQVGTGQLIPHPLYFGNFHKVLTEIPFLRYLSNTVIYAVLATIGVVVSSVPVAYAFSRLRWKGRDAVFVLVLATMMLPAQVTSVSLYIVFTRLHWVGTLLPLIVPTFFGDAFTIFLLRQFFMTIPQELSEAARIDGASEFTILRKVIIPLAKPAIAAVALFQFLYSWNDFYNPLLYTGNSASNMTLAVGLTQFTTLAKGNAYEVQMAASLMFVIPVIIIFFFAQKVFIEGVTLTGVKG